MAKRLSGRRVASPARTPDGQVPPLEHEGIGGYGVEDWPQGSPRRSTRVGGRFSA